MTRLLDEILDLSLLERGEARWVLEPVDAENVLERAIEASSGLASQASVRLLSAQRVGQAMVEADADRLSQVFINLLSNAIKYNDGAHPEVRIRSRIDADRYEMVIEDNGPGISPRDRERIFQKFSRGWSQKQSDRTGAGLGLAISWQIMNKLRGNLELMPADVGARFRVSLPILRTAPSPR
jgi:signal transduction histidine kinase